MTKPIYMTLITVKTTKILDTGDVQAYRETEFSLGAKESKTFKEANIWHNFLVDFFSRLACVLEKRPPGA